ncbi:MAG: Asd/ArgC dimerization domain-containing protein [Actinobacteria bacterium]|nr:Asd/ArgC dimerization domain-containing protein [Actinomycetota bacterium]
MAPGAGGQGPQLTFVPHLVPLQRGISETICVRTGTFPVPSQARVTELYEELYAGETFVEVYAAPQLKGVTGTINCRMFPYVDQRTGRLRAGRAEHERHARPARARGAGLR